ncbi:MAG: tRNA uridine-5-carboxymethylaminomethyl(34) synthesis GTPase MnmE [Pseudomonadota bacterium]
MRQADTIYALASGFARGGVQVVRISGPSAGHTLKTLTQKPLPPHRMASKRNLLDPRDGTILDSALCLFFEQGKSFTGEQTVEFHLHGGRAVLSGVLSALASLPSLRPAEPGEFTRQAFTNGRIDLAEAEGIGDLVAAETVAQRDQALRQMAGSLSARIETWRGDLIRAMALVEATIDFSDEDLPDGVGDQATAILRVLENEIDDALANADRGERIRDGIRVAIVGRPNVGKSSLLNALAGRDAAIVSDVAGTTRDLIEVALDLKGIPVVLTDTAGLREAQDKVEEEGVRRAQNAMSAADIVLFVSDFNPLGAEEDKSLWETVDELGSQILRVRSKSDLQQGATSTEWQTVSSATGQGMDELVGHLSGAAESLVSGETDPLITRARHRDALETCVDAIRRASNAELSELAAEDLRIATRALGRVTGRVDVEDLLDVIFRDFCIGK